jgi:hypothetical protein
LNCGLQFLLCENEEIESDKRNFSETGKGI